MAKKETGNTTPSQDNSPSSICENGSTPQPPTNIPLLIDGGGESDPTIVPGLGPLLKLVGTWNSPGPEGPGEPTGFFVMPLPQDTALNKFILSTFSYFEELTFSALDGGVTNRSGNFDQNNYVLFYEERVFFGSGQQVNQVVHAENGLLFNIETNYQGSGPLEQAPLILPPEAPNPLPQPVFPFVKQVSVPHGNSILAPGTHEQIMGPPFIPEVSTLPFGPGVNDLYLEPYLFPVCATAEQVTNPNLNLENYVASLENSDGKLTVNFTDIYHYSSENEDGGLLNIPFETTYAKAISYDFTYWLLNIMDNSDPNQPVYFNKLLYSQTINMQLGNNPGVTFPHITSNILDFVLPIIDEKEPTTATK